MKIVNGKWVDDNESKVDDFNFIQLKQISNNVSALYGNKITYDRINLVSGLSRLNEQQEVIVSNLLEDEKTISKIYNY